MESWKLYRKTGLQVMRPYVPGEDMTGIGVGQGDGPPELGGMIAMNSTNPSDQWYLSKKFFEENYEEAK